MFANSHAFLADGVRAVLDPCWPKPDPAAVCAAMDEAFRMADGAWDGRRLGLDYLRSAPAAACKVGCGWCCHQQVGVTVIEAVRIARHLGDLPADEGGALMARVTDTARRTAGMTTGERARSKIACAFLGADGRCMIYAVRPLRCRGLYSIDVQFCIDCHEKVDEMLARLERGEVKPAFLETPERIYDAALAGLVALLRARAPKALVTLELSAAVVALLRNPKLAALWLAGRAPDAAARLRPDPPAPGRF